MNEWPRKHHNILYIDNVQSSGIARQIHSQKERLMNRLKFYVVMGAVFVLITGTLSHFVYGWSGENPVAGLFFPVNESTWEHMKLVFFPTLIYGLFLYNKMWEDAPCIRSAVPAAILAGTASVPVLFYTYSGILGRDYFILDIAVFILSVLIAFFVLWRIARRDSASPVCQKTAGSLLNAAVILITVLFILFSYDPPGLGIFAEPVSTTARLWACALHTCG